MVLDAPVAASFDITFQCNLKCKMCHTWLKEPEISKDQELSTEQVVSTCNHLYKKHGVNIFRFLGGEPLLREDLVNIINAISPFSTTVITTNGLLLEENMCRALIKAGLKIISISLDGPREHCETVRGNGIYDKAVNGLKTMLRIKDELGSDIEVKVGNVVSKINLYHMEEVVAFAEDLEVNWYFWPVHHLYAKAQQTEWNGIPCGFSHPDPEYVDRIILSDKELKVFWKEYYRLPCKKTISEKR